MVTAITIYMLIWPVIVAVVLGVLIRGFFKDWKESRDAGRPII